MSKIRYFIFLTLLLIFAACALVKQPVQPTSAPTQVTIPEPAPQPTPAPQPAPQTIPEIKETAQPTAPITPPPSTKEFTIEADDAGLYPSSVEVNKGDTVKITFKVRSKGTYYGGLDFRSSVWGDTGKVPPGGTKTLEFTATQSFQYKSYWPASNVLKATGTVTVK